MKTRHARPARLPIDEWLPTFDENACRVEGLWPTLSTPDKVVEQADRRVLVRQTIDKLAENYRINLKLRDIGELSTTGVAAATRYQRG